MRYLTPSAVRLSLIFVCSFATVLHAQDGTAAADRAAIDAANARALAAYNAGDVLSFMQIYAPDATLMPPNGAAMQGISSITQYWQGGWKMGVRNIRLTSTEVDVHGGTASEVGRYEIDVQPSGAPIAHDHGKYIVLWKRDANGQWHWYRDIYNSDVAEAPAAVAQSGDTVWVASYKVRPDRRTKFEGFVTRFWQTGLDYGARRDSMTLATFQHTRVLYPTRRNADGSYTYMFVMDPVLSGANYDIAALLRRMLPAAQATEEYRAFASSLANDKPDHQQLWTMRQQ